jgi:hypothetical protein
MDAVETERLLVKGGIYCQSFDRNRETGKIEALLLTVKRASLKRIKAVVYSGDPTEGVIA